MRMGLSPRRMRVCYLPGGQYLDHFVSLTYNIDTMPTSRPMNNRRESLGFVLSDVARLIRRNFKQRLKDSCLTHGQARVLVHASRNEGIRQVELAEMLEVQPITLARLLDQLAKVGLIERRADPQDRRAYHIYLTRAATPHLAAIERVAKDVHEYGLPDPPD